MKKLYLSFLSLIFSISVLSQTGPGGVGNNDGSDGQPRNILWIDAQTLSLSNGDAVSSWPDISGNAHHMTSDGSDPSYATGIINSKNVVRFDNTNSEVLNFYSDFNTALDGVVSSNYTFFWVAARTGEDQQSYVFGGSTGSTNQNLYSGWGYPGTATEPDLCSNQWGNNCAADWDVGGSYDTRSLNTFAIVSSYLDNTSGRELFENGTTVASTTATDQLSSQTGTQLAHRSGGHYGDIDLAELIFYQTNLNVSQRIIVENYLSAKYNLALDANDYYSSTTHTYDVIGIGTTDGTDKHSVTTGRGGALYLEEDNTTLDGTNEFVMAGHDNTAHDVTTVDVADADRARWSRIFYLDKTTSGSIDVKIKFSTEEAGFGTPTDASDYKLLYRSGTTGDFSEVTVSSTTINTDNHVEFSVSDANFADGYYTLGVPAYKKWYTLISGDWDNHEIWTLDPSGALPNNPDDETPTTSTTSSLDKVYILNGKTVTISSNSKSNALLEVEGRLELGATTGHTFATIRGSGRIVMEADNFPSGTATHFITAGQGEGTAVFTGTSFDITNAQEFFNMEVVMDDASQELTLENDLTVNGNLYVNTGKFYINDDTKTDVINLTVSEDVNVSSGGEILTGGGDVWTANTQYHQFIVKGDFINEGTVKLTNRSAADYQNYETGGAVELIFNHATRNQEMQCNGTSNFNQITINKGTDDTYILSITATNSSNFNLYGRNDQQVTGVDGSRDGNKALRLLTGTAKLGSNITIPELADDNSFDIDSDARLWLDGATVTKGDHGGDDWFAIYGTLQISGASTFTEQTSYGTIMREQGTLKVEGGTVNLNVLRTSVWAGTHIGAYIQTGGDVYVKNESVNGDFATFHLGYESNVFQMSGGNLIIEDQGNGGDGDDCAMVINSSTGNYNVTGGTVIIDMLYDVPYSINSKAPFWNFIVRNSVDADQTLTIEAYTDAGGYSIPSVSAQPLVVLNDLTIEDNCTLDANGQNLEIVGDFNFNDGASYVHGNGSLKFFGDHNGSQINIGDNSTEPGLTIYKLEIDKDQNYNVSVLDDVDLISSGRADNSYALRIENDMLITRGEFDVQTLDVRLEGDIEIVDGNILYDATTPGYIELYNATTAQTIKGSYTAEQDFGNLELNNSSGATLLSNINVQNVTLTDGIMNLDVYNLDVSGDLSGTFGTNEMFETAGNIGDGGLTRYWDLTDATNSILFPIGSGAIYTPATINKSGSISDDGKFTINPVNSYHPALKPENTDKTIPYYWVVDTADFSTVTYGQIQYIFDYPGTIPNNAKRGTVLWDADWTWYDKGNCVSGSTVTFPYDTYLTTEFAVGNPSIFKTPEVYYSTTVGRGNDTDFNNNDTWDNPACWSTVGHYSSTNNGDYPQAGDIAVMGFGLENSTSTVDNDQRSHWFFVDADVDVGKIIFAEEVVNADGISVPRTSSYQPQLIINNDAALDFIAGAISGNGTFNVEVGCSTCDADPGVSVPVVANIDADFTDFANNLNSRFDYDLYINNNTAVYLPTSFPEIYPNVMVKGQNGTNRTLIFQEDILIQSNLTIRENAVLRLSGTTNGDIEVLGDLNFTINAGDDQLQFPTSGNERTFTLSGDILMEDGDADQITVLNTTPSALEHRFRLGGSIDKQGGNTIDLFTNNTGGNNVILEFFGDASSTFTSDDNPPDLYRIEMNKVSGNEMHIQTDFDIGGPTDGDPKAIELISGDLFLDNSGINIDLNTGGADFKIPSGTSFQIKRGIVNVSGNNTGIWLDDRLTIGFQGQVLCNGGTNNYIEYTNSGNSEIHIEQGTLRVGSQIRRSMTVSTGVLHFTQNKQNSTIVIGEDGTAPENNRGIFELIGSSSTFTQSEANSEITIACQQDNPSVPSLYFKDMDAANVSIATGSKFIIGGDAMTDDQDIGIYSNVNLNNITVESSNGFTSKATMWTVPLTLDENLVIESGSEFDANGLDLTILGDFTNNSGTFIANENNTYFSGTATQDITGTATFYNLYKNTSNLLNINNDIDVDNILSLSGGTFDDNDNTLSVQGNVNMEITHTWGGTSDGILMNGTAEQVLTGGGTFGKLSLFNSYGISVPTGNEFTITGELQMQRGVLDIGKNLLILESNADIVELSAFSENNMIQTNISFTDAGVKKFFPAIAASTVFTYPIGSEGKYTPVEMTISNVNSGGYIRVKGANEIHPTISDDTEPCNEINDLLNVLKYHWVLEAGSISSFNADVTMEYYASDYQAPSAPYTVDDYIAARLLFNSTSWNKYDANTFDENNNLLRFSFTNAGDNEISGDYTAGVEDQTGSCEGAIPDEVPAYISKADGNWTDETKWETYPTAGGTVPVGGPKGAIAIVVHDITVPTSYIVSYKTTIQSTGTVDVGTTYGHRLGIVDGEGTLRTERGDLPAGVYDDFFGRNGGTIDYSGSDDYDVLSEITNVRNLTFSGTGERRLPNLDFEAYGVFTLDGDDATLAVINEHDAIITLDSNIVINQGSFEAGDVDAKVILNGTSLQTISGTGDFTGTNAFWNLEMDNTAGVTLSTPVDVDNNLTFINGIITTDATNILTIENLAQAAVTGYGSSNYVDGPLKKYVNSGEDFVFPVGDAGRYGAVNIYNTTNASSAYWIAEYFNTGHASNSIDGTSSLVAVSENEYWEITNPTAGDAAEVELRWDSYSDITPLTTGDIDQIVVAEYDGTDWEDKTSDNPSGDNYDGTVKTTNAINIDPKQYTLGSNVVILAKAYFTTLDDVCEGSSIPVSFSGVDNTNNNFSLDYDYDDGTGAVSNTVTFSSLPYSLPTTDGAGDYVLTGFEYNSGGDVGVVDGSTVTVNPAPNQFNVTGGGSYCSGGSGVTVGLDGSEAGVNYELFVGTTSLGIYAGTGAALDFGNQTAAGTYTVEATNGTTSCTQSMAGSATVTVYDLPAVTMTVNSALDTICNGDNTEISLSFTAGAPNYDFTISDGTNTENLNSGGSNPYTYTPATPPVWDVADGAASTITYTITYIEDANGCTNTGDNTVDVVVYKIPVTGNLFTPPNN